MLYIAHYSEHQDAGGIFQENCISIPRITMEYIFKLHFQFNNIVLFPHDKLMSLLSKFLAGKGLVLVSFLTGHMLLYISY